MRIIRSLGLILFTMLTILGCKSSDSIVNESDSNSEASTNEVKTIRLGMIPSSGHVFDAIAKDKGFYEEEDIEVEIQYINTGTEAFQAILAGKLDIASTFGTGTPVQMISTGSDLMIIGGYMLEGAMPVIGRPGNNFKSVEDFLGKKVAMLASNYQITGPLIDLGYDAVNEIEIVEMAGQMDKIEAVKSGEVDYALMATGIGFQAMQQGLEEVTFSSDLLPEYSCCRVVTNGTWFKENEETVKKLLKCWIRAQQVFEADRAYAVDLLEDQLDVPREQIEHYILDEEHYELNLDPGKKIVSRAYYYLDRMGMIGEDSRPDILDERVNVDSYKEALDEVIKNHYDEDPAFYDKQVKYYEENDTKKASEYLEEYGYGEYLKEKGYE